MKLHTYFQNVVAYTITLFVFFSWLDSHFFKRWDSEHFYQSQLWIGVSYFQQKLTQTIDCRTVQKIQDTYRVLNGFIESL
jgi:hypothetical protein